MGVFLQGGVSWPSGRKTMTDPHIGFRFASAGDAAGGFSSLSLDELSVGLIRFLTFPPSSGDLVCRGYGDDPQVKTLPSTAEDAEVRWVSSLFLGELSVGLIRF